MIFSIALYFFVLFHIGLVFFKKFEIHTMIVEFVVANSMCNLAVRGRVFLLGGVYAFDSPIDPGFIVLINAYLSF